MLFLSIGLILLPSVVRLRPSGCYLNPPLRVGCRCQHSGLTFFVFVIHIIKDDLWYGGFDKQISVMLSEILIFISFLGPWRAEHGERRSHDCTMDQDIRFNHPKGSYVLFKVKSQPPLLKTYWTSVHSYSNNSPFFFSFF